MQVRLLILALLLAIMASTHSISQFRLPAVLHA